MSPEEIYLRFLQKVNKNYTNDNISVDKGRFVFLFNSSQDKFISWTLEKKNVDDIREIQNLIVYDKKLKEKNSTSKDHQKFEIPTDFLEFSNVKGYAEKDKCRNQKIHLFEVKNENLEEVLQDEFNKPSFEYREAPFTVSSNNINVFIDDFKFTKVLLNYYRNPIQLDIEGYIKVNNTPSKSVTPEFSGSTLDKIIDIAVKEFNINSDNLNRAGIDKDRIQTDF